LLLVKVTGTPAGAAAVPVMVKVTLVDCPETTVVGLKATIETTGGITDKFAPANVLPLGRVGVILPIMVAATAVVVTVKEPRDALPEMGKLVGTFIAVFPIKVLDRLTVNPACGAGPLNNMAPVTVFPPVTVLELSV